MPKAKDDPTVQARHGDRAIKLLSQAIALGWSNAEHTDNDPDFNPIRNREEFKKLMVELENSPAKPEVAPKPPEVK